MNGLPRLSLALVYLSSIVGAAAALAETDRVRTHEGLIALYDFGDAKGPLVRDRSGVGDPLDLRIGGLKAGRREAGSLEIRGTTLVQSASAANKVTEAIRNSGELSIEVWLRPSTTDLTGPARIVTISQDPSHRNFTLGQDGDRFDARLRTSRTSTNGIPSLPAARKSLKAELTHVVYTRGRGGRARIYVNGKQSAEKSVAGNLKNWNNGYRLALANELTGDRPWQGTYYLVAIYGRALTAEEVQRNFRAGSGSEAVRESLVQARLARNRERFNKHVAPLLVKHCFECHDAATREGGLDLSQRKTALAGGESGRVIMPGNSAESLLWDHVASDEMPKERDALSAEEKRVLREWIDEGATWTADVVDPAVYENGGRAANVFVQRLTVAEYIETVRSAVGIDIEEDARKLLPPEVRADGFRNTAYNLSVDLGHVEAYAQLAEMIVRRMDVAKFAGRFSKRNEISDENMRGLIRNMGRWLLRGPLTDREVDAYLRISQAVARQKGDFSEAAGYIIEAMLQSPRFIYRIEQQRGDGAPRDAGPYELASRLSYIIWGGPPDEELFRAAAAGELADREKTKKQVARMLKDPRATERSKQFLTQWLNLARLDNLRPDPQRYPHWSAELAADMRAETLAFFEEIAWNQQRPLADLFNAQVTFATPRLAEHYGLRVKESVRGAARYDLSSIPARGGLLTQGAVLTIGGDEASMVSRGLFVLHDVLRGKVKDPPPGVDTTPVPTKEGLTQRGIALMRIADNKCGGCHGRFEPLAFGLERFDGLGAYRERDEHGNALREDGEVHIPGQPQPVQYKTSAALMNLLAQSERVRETLTWKVTQFALGRPLIATDAPSLAKIHADAQAAGGTYAGLITAIVMSDLVRQTRTEPSET